MNYDSWGGFIRIRVTSLSVNKNTQKVWPDFHETWWTDAAWTRVKLIRFCDGSGFVPRSRISFSIFATFSLLVGPRFHREWMQSCNQTENDIYFDWFPSQHDKVFCSHHHEPHELVAQNLLNLICLHTHTLIAHTTASITNTLIQI